MCKVKFMEMILNLHDELHQEHSKLAGDWLGRPKKRHHQIVGASRALKELMNRVSKINDD